VIDESAFTLKGYMNLKKHQLGGGCLGVKGKNIKSKASWTSLLRERGKVNRKGVMGQRSGLGERERVEKGEHKELLRNKSKIEGGNGDGLRERLRGEKVGFFCRNQGKKGKQD